MATNRTRSAGPRSRSSLFAHLSRAARSTISSIAAVLTSMCAMTPTASAAVPEPQCEVETTAGDAREFACTLGERADTRRFRIEAGFSGSHDDTVLDMTATLDGKPVACAEGSTTHSQGVDGDIALVCRFDLKAEATASVLRVKLRWRHAEPADFNVASE